MTAVLQDRTLSPFTEDEESCRQTVRAFLDAELEPHYDKFVGNLDREREFWFAAGRAGILGASLPEAYGGAGLSELIAVIVSQELGRSIGAATIGSSLAADLSTHVLVEHGTPEQIRRFAPGILTGALPQSVAITEAEAGSDATAMTTTAVREGDHYVVNGSKIFITNGNKAGLIHLFVKTDPSKRGSGISMLLVEGDTPGLSRHPLQTMGCPAYDLAELHFDDMRVPVENLVLGEGRGMEILMHTFPIDRLQIAARALGEAELAFTLALDHVKNRTAFGGKIFDLQNTQFVLAEMRTEIEVGRAFLAEAVRRYRLGVLSMAEAAMTKLWIPEMSGRVVDRAIQLFGGSGYIDEMPISRLYTANRLHRIYAGTDEMQKVTIARSL